ncbi:uncharacterized protein VP01_608g5 [Puccinia sorghi]|uniref:Uncharacterized protein n=1 Tax=Puccinia sorghi TaxID=27349 RepID=A0A0L6UJ94_9BASI|nr:uncharacterized protein VP01_608g5 [Puccinia sorghi]
MTIPLVRINQTKTVYQYVESDSKILSKLFHNMLFGTIQRCCQISQYYNGWLYFFFSSSHLVFYLHVV